VKAVIAESFERIHRSNLVGFGVLPLQFPAGTNRRSLGLTGRETLTVRGIAGGLAPRQRLTVEVSGEQGERSSFEVECRIDTVNEIRYYQSGGILHYVLRGLLGKG
jgi:aconitate hydratase